MIKMHSLKQEIYNNIVYNNALDQLCVPTVFLGAHAAHVYLCCLLIFSFFYGY